MYTSSVLTTSKTVTASTTPQVLVAQNYKRCFLKITNNSATVDVYVGPATVTTGAVASATGGAIIPAKGSMPLERTQYWGEWWVVTDASTAIVCVQEAS